MKEEEEKNPNASSSKAWFVTLQGTSPFKPWNCLPDLCHYLDRQARWWVSEADFFLLSGVGAKLNLGKLDLNPVFAKTITLTRVSVVHCKHWKLCKDLTYFGKTIIQIVLLYECCKSCECYSQTKHWFFLLIGIRQQLETVIWHCSWGQGLTWSTFIYFSVQSCRGKTLNIYKTFISSSLKCLNAVLKCGWVQSLHAWNFPATHQLFLFNGFFFPPLSRLNTA